MSETIGTGKINLTLDLSGMTAAIASGRKQLTGFGTDAEAAFNQSNSKAKTAALSLARYIEMIGKSADEVKVLRAQWAGVDNRVLDAMTQKLALVRDGETAAAAAAREMGESWTAMQAKARGAFKELESAAREQQLLRDGIAAKKLALDIERANHAAQGLEFKSMQADTARVNRMRQAVSAFGGSLAELDTQENRATAAGRKFIAMARDQESALRRGNGAVKAAGIEFNKYGLSAKQELAALRQVPAQITDIFVSLQGGQRPLTVLLQQGGQLKDVFGGVRPAFTALTRAVLKFVNPATITLGILGAIGVALYKGEAETNAYAQALALTGNQAGVTVSQLQSMAVQIQEVGVTQGESAEAITAVAKSGKFTATQFQLVAEAAIQMKIATGTAIDDTISKFADLARDPVSAVSKLNEETHFLTLATYEQIRALQEQGDTQAAATLAMNSYADTVQERTDNVKENLGTLQKAWRGVAVVAKAAWDAMLDIGRESLTSDKILQLGDDLDKLKNSNWAYGQYGLVGSDARKKVIADKREQLRALLKEEREGDRKEYLKAAGQEANDYAVAQQQSILAHRSADEKRAAEITRSRGESIIKEKKALAAGNKELAAAITANQKEYEKVLNAQAKKPKKTKTGDGGVANAQAGAELQALKDSLALEQSAIKNSSDILRAEFAARLVTEDDYYAKERVLLTRGMEAQESALTQQIAVLRKRSVAGKDSINVQKEIGKLETALAKARADNSTKQEVLDIQQEGRDKKRKQALEEYTDAAERQVQAVVKGFDAKIAAITLSDKEAEKQSQLAAIYDTQTEALRRLQAQKAAGDIDQGQYDAYAKVAADAANDAVSAVEDGYDRMAVAQADWLNGLTTGIQNWVDQTSNVAAQVQAITTHALDATADAFTNLALTGKFEIKKLLADILSEVAKFMMKQAILNFIKAFAGSSMNSWGFQGGTSASTFAKGDTFSGSPSLSAYSGTVVSQPTPFYFAKGAGVMGEAGDEGIFPLKRGPDGKLGISASGSGSNVQISVATTINNDGTSSSKTSSKGDDDASLRAFTERMRMVASEEVQRAMMPGGNLWKVGVSAQ